MSEEFAQAEKGHRAERFLNDEVFSGAVARVEARLSRQWRESAPEDRLAREQFYFVQRALREVITELTKEIDAGRIAQSIISRRKG